MGGSLDLSPFAVPKAHAQNQAKGVVNLSGSLASGGSKLGLVVILVENDLLKSTGQVPAYARIVNSSEAQSTNLREHIFAYAENIQKRLPHTRAVVIGVDPDESTYKISTVLEKMYYEGVDNDLLDESKLNDDTKKEDDNQLSGIVIVGDVPIPVVYDKDGVTSPSIYPYTDFYRKRYIYNHETNHFEINKTADRPTPEIWHGIIKPPSSDDKERRQQLADYFDKNNQYSNGFGEYAEFNQRLMYYNFPAVEKKLNTMDYGNYRRNMLYTEEIAFQRFNRHLLKDVIDRIAEEMEPDKAPSERTPLMDDASIEMMSDSSTEFLFKKFTSTFGGALQTYLGRLNPIIGETGRWSKDEYDSLASLITMRDAYMQTMLMGKMVELENKINAEVEKAQKKIRIMNNLTVSVTDGNSVNLHGYIDGYRIDGGQLGATLNGMQIDNYIPGMPTPPITSAEQCGLLRGQKRPGGVPVIKNNSVLTEANRTYNPNTTVIPPDDSEDSVEDLAAYNWYGGATANNSFYKKIDYDNDDDDIHIHKIVGPHLVRPESAVMPVFDAGGSKEIDFEWYDSEIPEPNSSLAQKRQNCALEGISFLPETFQVRREGLYVDDDSVFREDAYCFGVACLNGTEWHEAFFELFQSMSESGRIQINIIPQSASEPNDPYFPFTKDWKDYYMPEKGYMKAHLHLRKIIQSLFSDNQGSLTPIENKSITYQDSDNNNVTMNFIATYKFIDSMVRHQEPTKATADSIQQFMTPNTPADGIRLVEWFDGTDWQRYQYPNLFRVSGVNLGNVISGVAQMIQSKDAELNQLLGEEKNLVKKFFLENADLVEPILWRNLGIDQKHQMIFEKYLNRDSFLPVPDPNGMLPTTKPKGYEVLHIMADGDEQGFEFGINRSDLSESQLADLQMAAAAAALAAAEDAENEQEASGEGDGEGGSLFSCGPSDGVEIWEWPDAVICWIEEEVSNLSDALSLDNSCGSSDILQEPNIDILTDTSLAVFNPANVPSSLRVHLPKKTLVKEESIKATVSILNSEEKTIIGYLDDPLLFNVNSSPVANFNEREVLVFTGVGSSTLTANQPGQGNVEINLGGLHESIPIRVVGGINILLNYERDTESNRPAYKITATLVDNNGNAVQDVDTNIRLNTLNPMDGMFVQNLLRLQDGMGETLFFPNPAAENIRITATHPVYTSSPIALPSIVGEPFKIVIEELNSFPLAETIDLRVAIADVNTILTPSFNDSIQVHVTDKFKKYGELESETIPIINGRGTLRLKIKSETGQINLVAEHEKLAPGFISTPIIARIDQQKWSETFPQNLFASFVGFPAANFLEENYFGGVHLFSGKTEAVFGFIEGLTPTPILNIQPNYSIQTTLPNQIIKVQPLGDQISLQVIDSGSLESLVSTVAPLDFEKVKMWDEEIAMKEGELYFELTKDTYSTTVSGESIKVYDDDENLIIDIQKNNLHFYQLDYELFHEPESDHNLLELILANPNGEIGRLRLNFKPRQLNKSSFNPGRNWALKKTFAGKSTSDPTGLALYDPNGEIDPALKLSENFGFEGDNKYILRFGGGSSAGDAVKYNLPYNAVLLGDPTIRLKNDSVSSLNYDNTIGRQIFQDPEGSDVAAITNFDFNKDNIQDAAVVMKDGRIRLFEGGATEPLYRDRGNIAFLADGTLDAIAFDFKNDGYEDLLVATREGRLAILHNDGEVITRTDQKIEVGKQLYQIKKADMDADGYEDLVTVDSRGDIRIFYNQSRDLLAFGASGLIPPDKQFREKGTFIETYGFTPTKDNIKDNLQIRYPGMPESEGAPVPTPGVSTEPEASPEPSEDNPYGLPNIDPPEPPDWSELAEFADRDTSEDISESAAKAHVQGLRDATQNAAEGNVDPEIPLLPWSEGDQKETYFAPLSEFSGYSTAVKKVINRDRPDDCGKKQTKEGCTLDIGEALKYTITLTSTRNINNFVLADTVPDALTFIEESVECLGEGCADMKSEFKGIYLFISNLNLKNNSPITITYEANVKSTPEFAVMLKRLDSSTALNRSDVPFDAYIDILVSPPYNNTGQLMAHYTIAPRTYRLTTTKKEENTVVNEALAQNTACQDALAAVAAMMSGIDLEDEDFEPPPEDFMDDVNKYCGLDQAADALESGNTDPSNPKPPSPEECATNPQKCAGGVMDDIASSINDFICMGGGCFPMPYNMAFLAPQSIPMAMPILSFPTTIITGVGPLPVPGTLAMIPMPLGHTDVPGTFNSLIRLYMIPTLTGGVGIGLCWGPYMGSAPVPPPLVPIAYPPPIGNCMTIALPMGANPACGAIEDAITSAMEAANSVISDVNSGISAVNNGGVPVELQQGDEQGSAGGSGGLEISLATNLGDAQKFEPPAKGFSNISLSSFDSIGGVIASWLDRQLSEILNKLLTMPTIRVIIPDIQGMFMSDAEQFSKVFEAFKQNVLGTARDAFSEEATDFNTRDSEVGWIEGYEVVEKEIKAFNTNVFEDVYALINEIPFIEVKEHYIDFKVPYISYVQLNEVIRDLKNVLNYYERQYQKWVDTLEHYVCPDTTAGDCIAVKVLQVFVADFEPFIESIQKNIETLESYLTFPRDVIMLKQEFAQYIKTLSCYLDSIREMLGGWLLTIQEQLIGWIEVYTTMIEVIKNVKDLIDLFTNFEDNCDICTNERFGNFGWFTLLGLVIPDIPIVKFPRFPDLVIDLSNFKAQITLEVPSIHIILEPVKLPKIPKIPLPDIPDLTDLQLLAQIPPLPILPALPELPKLPELPSLPMVDLPTLPPPPKLPDIGAAFEVVIPLLEMILNIWCMIKKSFSPIPEAYLHDHIVLLTNRPSYMIPLDMLKPKIGDIGALETDFNELRVEVTTYLGLRIGGPLKVLSDAADWWNKNVVTDISEVFNELLAEKIREATDFLDEKISKIEDLTQEGLDFIEEGWDATVQNTLDQWGMTMEEFDEKYFRGAENSMQELSDDMTAEMGSWSAAANDWLINSFDEMNKAIDDWDQKVVSDINTWHENIALKWIRDAAEGFDYEEWFQKEVIDFSMDHVNDWIAEGVITADQWAKQVGEWLSIDSPQWMQDLGKAINDGFTAVGNAAESGIDAASDAYEGSDIQDVIQGDPLSLKQSQPSAPEYLKVALMGQIDQLKAAVDKANNNWVDYKIVKEDLGVPNYHLPKQITAVDRIEAIQKELLTYGNQLETEAHEVGESADAFALIQQQANAPLPFSFAKKETVPKDRQITTSSVSSKRLAQVPKGAAPSASAASVKTAESNKAGNTGRCIGSCLVDPVTGSTVQFIPHFDNPATTNTGFIPAIPGESHVLYNDADSLYLKENLVVPKQNNVNVATRVSNIIFDLNHFISIGNTVMPLKEAVNMLSVALTENGAANFKWMPSTHPELYGYGIELERSILGFDASHLSTPLSDITIVLLPSNEDGSTPRVTVGKQVIPYGTLVTSLDDRDEAREKFGIPAKAFQLHADKIKFETIGGVTMTLNDNRAVYFDVYDGPAYRMSMDNGFYHIRMTWFDQMGRIANYNHAELLSPQIYIDAPPPIDIRFDQSFLIPIYEEGVVAASRIFMDFSDTLQYQWEFDSDQFEGEELPIIQSDRLLIPRQKKPKKVEVTVIANDLNGNEYKKPIKVEIYTPEISLKEGPLKEGTVEGGMERLDPTHDLIDMPLSVFRKRWGTWKNLGLLKKKTGPPSVPPISEKNTFEDNYYASKEDGYYHIEEFTYGPSNVLVSDNTQKDVARVHIGTGQIEILDQEYELQAIPASRQLPTRVAVVKKGFDTVLSNIYYVADESTDVEILEEPLNQRNIKSIGVTIGDRNPNDVIIAHNMPGYAESYPGGAAIFNDQTQINVALINSDGAIRMMQAGYSLRIKNEGQLDEKIIFEIIDQKGSPVFDIFIAADFNNLNIRQEEIWDELKATIGYLKDAVKPIFASLLAQSKPQIPKPATQESPFQDLDSSHPYYQQILDLYKRRIVSGYGDGSFQPDAKLSRAEFVKIALGSTNCFDCTRPTDAQRSKYQSTRPFPDVSLPAWYHYCVAIAKELGMVTGYGDGYFRPSQNISRAEAVAVLLRQSEIELTEAPEEYFQDVPDYAWYVDYVYIAVEAGLIQSNAGFVFPDEEITRGEFAFMASGVLQIQDCRLVDTDGDGIPDWWEMENNLDPMFAGDALYDVDEDFCTTLEEFQAGSDPNDPASACRFECLCLDNPNQNDTDKDGTIDPCDDDLDGDGVTNTVCMFDESGLVDPKLAADSEDNCIFVENADQIDYDQDKTGDVCLPIDQCPEVPEDLDGYHDLDGCPEVFDDTTDNPPGVYVNKGPACYFLDWEKDFVAGDVIMTAITDVMSHDVIYKKSNEVTY